MAFNNDMPDVAYSDYGHKGNAAVMFFSNNNWEVLGSPGFSAGQASYISISFNSDPPYVAYQDGGYNNAATVMVFKRHFHFSLY